MTSKLIKKELEVIKFWVFCIKYGFKGVERCAPWCLIYRYTGEELDIIRGLGYYDETKGCEFCHLKTVPGYLDCVMKGLRWLR